MQAGFELLRRDEKLTLSLRALYERYGYQKFRMNRFEEYDFYQGNRDFLADGQIITFTGLDGKLMALRPDVTLSIVKKARPEKAGVERLYYTESVFRPGRDVEEYREASQVGVECIGDVTPYTATEIVLLASQTLSLAGASCVLEISHTGFVDGLLASLPLPEDDLRLCRRLIEGKNAHDLREAFAARLPEGQLSRLCALAKLSGPFPQALPEAAALAEGDMMRAAVQELTQLYQTLSAAGEAEPLRLDFSISGDATYYSGLMLRGYVGGVPRAVLSGGRYDPLLRRMGKPGGAMGFALYVDQLMRSLADQADTAVDTVVLYDADTDPAVVWHVVQSRVARGERVFAATSLPENMRWQQVLEVRGHA